MIRSHRRYFVLLVILLAIALSLVRVIQYNFSAREMYAKGLYVAKVMDGDTIELSNGTSVRYIGIDTPELRDKSSTGWIYNPRPYAEEAREFNRRLVEGKIVRLEFDVQKKDKYGRLLAYVYIDDKMVNLEMVRQGYAMVYTYPPNVKYVDDFLNAQRQARLNNRGLWNKVNEGEISSYEARENLGLIRQVKTEVINTYLSDSVLVLHCRDGFQVVIFKNLLSGFPPEARRFPDGYFKHKTIKVYGVLKEYRGSVEIVIHDPSQIEILE